MLNKSYFIPKIICVTLLWTFIFNIDNQLKCQNYTKQYNYQIFRSWVLKPGPYIDVQRAFPKFRGGNLTLETNINKHFSLQNMLSYRFLPNDTSSLKYFYSEHQIRFWTGTVMKGFYVAPVLSYYSIGELSYGGFMGYQNFLYYRIVWETWIGLQKTTSIENYISPIYVKVGFRLGWKISP